MPKTKIRYSHSAFSTFRHCEKQFDYSYVQKLEANTDKWKAVKDLGTAIHEGIAVVLQTLALAPNMPATSDDILSQVDIATIEAIAKHDELVDKNKKDWAGDRDDQYYTDMAYNREIIPALIEMHIPMMELGSRYRPAMASEFGFNVEDQRDPKLGHAWVKVTTDDFPLVEYSFEFDNVTFANNVEAPIQGIVDAVLYDMKTGHYILFDWKVRGRLLDPVAVGQDFQLPLYATILNAMSKTDARITVATMYQMLKTVPKPAKILKKGNISTASCASHWDFWWNSIAEPQREKMDHDEWYALMVGGGKLRDIESWVSAVEVPITANVMQEVSYVTDLTIDRINANLETDSWVSSWLPSWSAHGCEFCQFKKLCQARRHGMDEASVIKELYRERTQ